ncbi:hypothetical protein C9374_012647 [Naegleria lovaniensis]|uniref:Uncharacterized protein n=1 Tax=Naegleria lovaniensis TaxID=51637 RepID=A0AA88KW88_NAELO|nr:uncharacterized protein C9374_012647 [Naegleria lovaniensis]KAG2392395.1 hypothetical protein C9374_012647 [Naegleria lovaniensis]
MCEQGQLNCTQYGGPPLEIKGSTFGPDKFLNLAPTNVLNMTFNGTLLNVVEFTCPLLCSNDSIQWTTLCEEKTENVTITERFCLNSNSDYCASLTSLYIQGINEIFRHHDVSGSILFSYFLRPILPSLIFNVFNFFRKFLFNFSHINSLGAAMVTVAMLALFYVTLFIAVAIKYSILLGAPNLVSVLVSSIVTAIFVQWVLEFLVMPPILALVPTSRFDSYEKSQTGELCTEACCFGKSLCEMWFVRKLTYLNNHSSTDKEEEMTKEKSKPTEFTFVVVMVSLQVIVWTMYAFSLMALGKVITWSYILFYQTLFNYLLTKIMIFYERRYLNAKGDTPKRRLLFMFSIFTFIGVFVVCVSIHILTVVLIPFVNYYW